MKKLSWFVACCCLMVPFCQAQPGDDLLSLLGDEEPEINYARAGFKTTRVINNHSFENTAHGVLDFKISHRFGFVNTGAYELFGLDRATMRMGFDYGVTDKLMLGFGRSTFEKTFDGYVKYKFLRQSTGKKNMPISAALVSTIALNSLRFQNPERQKDFSSRLAYTHQLIIGRKMSESLSWQIMPTMVHRNLVRTREESNDVFAMGVAARQKITKRVAINAEYHYVFPDQLAKNFTNPLSIGFDIETGGHVFQLHFTNATAMNEKGFITESIGKWDAGDIRFGFNISRVFTLHRPER